MGGGGVLPVTHSVTFGSFSLVSLLTHKIQASDRIISEGCHPARRFYAVIRNKLIRVKGARVRLE